MNEIRFKFNFFIKFKNFIIFLYKLKNFIFRKDNEEREYLLDRAQKDKDKLRNFVRLIDYIVEETLYSTNFVSMQALFDEMKKTGRK